MGIAPTIDRHKTAIGRAGLSRPVASALDDEVLSTDRTFFDYGCGRGQDVARLSALGYTASGWDPAHASTQRLAPADVVNLGYVVNVVEDPAERAFALTSAWQLAKRTLIVAARMDWEARALDAVPHADGVLTRKNTFQKFYTQDELRTWIDRTLDATCVAAAPGIFYVFRSPADAEELRARRVLRTPRPAHSAVSLLIEAHHEELSDLQRFVRNRGRLPQAPELPSADVLVSAFGSLKRAFSVVQRATDEDWSSFAQRARDDLLVYLALAAFRGRPKFRDLPASMQLDLRALFGSYRDAQRRADELLFSLADRAALEKSIREMPTGKVLPDAVYVHKTALDLMPALFRVYEGCAQALVGRVSNATILKFARLERKVSYLSYPSFDRDPHPSLATSMRVNLLNFDVRFRDFATHVNPPLLHRKESFILPDYDGAAKFARLTSQEERAGLLDAPGIGTKNGWNQALQQSGFKLTGHRLVRGAPGGNDHADDADPPTHVT